MRLFQNKMNKFSKILTIAMVLAVSAVFAGAVLAADEVGTAGASPIQNIDQLLIILKKIVVLMYRAFFIVAIGAVILAAFTYLTGGDDPEKIKSATHKIIYAAIAIAVALISVGANVIIKDLIGK
jgi:hypothetical protein